MTTPEVARERLQARVDQGYHVANDPYIREDIEALLAQVAFFERALAEVEWLVSSWRKGLASAEPERRQDAQDTSPH